MGRKGLTYEPLAICRMLALARAVFAVPIEEKLAVHDPKPDARRQAISGERLVSCSFGPFAAAIGLFALGES